MVGGWQGYDWSPRDDGQIPTAVVGASDLIVVHTPEATLVCHKDKAQEIKALLKRLADDPVRKKYL